MVRTSVAALYPQPRCHFYGIRGFRSGPIRHGLHVPVGHMRGQEDRYPDARDSFCSRDGIPSSAPMHVPARIESAPTLHRSYGTASRKFSASVRGSSATKKFLHLRHDLGAVWKPTFLQGKWAHRAVKEIIVSFAACGIRWFAQVWCATTLPLLRPTHHLSGY